MDDRDYDLGSVYLDHRRPADLLSKVAQACITKQEQRVIDVEKSQTVCQKDCRDTYVNKADYIRNALKNERKMDKLIETVVEIRAAIVFFERIPQVCGEIVKQVVKELNTKEPLK